MQPEQIPQQTQTGLIYQCECWYFPPNKGMTIFSMVRSYVYVYMGWLVIINKKTNQEINRIQITSDALFARQFGQVSIKRNAGRKIGMFEKGYLFMFYNPMLMFLTYLVAFSGNKKARPFLDACNQARPQV